MGVNGECIYYKTMSMSGMVSGTSNPLTFIEAMSCVRADGTATSLSSNSYFRNVRFTNATLYSTTAGVRDFSTLGSSTYYVFVCEPSGINYSFSGNTETESINYNN